MTSKRAPGECPQGEHSNNFHKEKCLLAQSPTLEVGKNDQEQWHFQMGRRGELYILQATSMYPSCHGQQHVALATWNGSDTNKEGQHTQHVDVPYKTQHHVPHLELY